MLSLNTRLAHLIDDWSLSRRTASAAGVRTRLTHGPHRTHALAISLTRIGRLEFRLLARGEEVRVLLEIFDDLFGHDLPLESAQRAFNRFVRIDCYERHTLFSPPFCSDFDV